MGPSRERLPQELRLRGIRSIPEANRFLRELYVADHNAKFSVPSAQEATAFVPCAGADLEKIFSHQQERVVGNDNTVTFGKLRLQIAPQTFRFSLARCRVIVCRHLDGSLAIHYGPHRLGRYEPNGTLLAGQKTQKEKIA